MNKKPASRSVALAVVLIVVVIFVAGMIVSDEPDVAEIDYAGQNAGVRNVTGVATVTSLIDVTDKLLTKTGGYLTNDVLPPGSLLDNMPNWEYGALTQVRDLARAVRNDMSRSQTQSTEDKDLSEGEPQLHFDNDSWLFPATESEYRKGIDLITKYRDRLADDDEQNAQFYARADNLASWLELVEKRLGSLSQRLSASVGQQRINTDLAGDASATQSTRSPRELEVKTSWWEIDDVLYEARGASWALLHFLKAVDYDFRDILEKKNAVVSLRQIIRELEATQQTLWSPMVLNGSGFGIFANHSLVMASYISRANSAVIDLRTLLQDG